MNNEHTSIYNGPIFLIGMPRSGTKLLRSLLNQHPQIAIPEIETEFLPGLLNDYSVNHKFSRSEFSDLYCSIIKFPYFRYMSEHRNIITEKEWFSACNDYSLSDIFEALIRYSTNTVGKNEIIWGDKSPSYICHIGLLKEIYPSAKFIHIVRDVRDYVVSMSNAWGKNKLRAAQRWADSLDKAHADITYIKDDVIVVKYEELLDNHETILRKIIHFLELPFDERVLKLLSVSENLGDAKGYKEIISDNKNKYKSVLTTKKISSIERLAGHTMVNYGYSVGYTGSRRRLHPWELKYYQFLDAVNLVLFERKKRGLYGSIIFYWNYYRATRGI